MNKTSAGKIRVEAEEEEAVLSAAHAMITQLSGLVCVLEQKHMQTLAIIVSIVFCKTNSIAAKLSHCGCLRGIFLN
ncbi:unnamed protein product [Ilex paraguariensis]|uniref:Uncharacterized protein n=1 Tax=Ilex paraguariensis TaxID=185542 RepID=A0ABC8S1A0_9AQUA